MLNQVQFSALIQVTVHFRVAWKLREDRAEPVLLTQKRWLHRQFWKNLDVRFIEKGENADVMLTYADIC